MDEKRRNQRKEILCSFISSDLRCSLEIISFNGLVRADYHAKIVNRSIIGIGIETDYPMHPGVVWFKDIIQGQKCGVLMWCNQIGNQYRSGIRFVSLTRLEEEYFLYILEQVKPSNPVRDPDRIIARLNGSIPKN